jgi:hypothetical protein
MTNEQLAVLIRGYEKKLRKCICDIEKELPSEMKEEWNDMFGNVRRRSLILDGLDDLHEQMHDACTYLLGTDKKRM